MRVPECFEQHYEKERQELVKLRDDEENKGDYQEKKLWREHRHILRRYLEEKARKKSRRQVRNRDITDKMLPIGRNNFFLKKIIEKGTKFEYDKKKFEEEILHKLRVLKQPNTKSSTRTHAVAKQGEEKQVKIE